VHQFEPFSGCEADRTGSREPAGEIPSGFCEGSEVEFVAAGL
jgi:hypothetical protein